MRGSGVNHMAHPCTRARMLALTLLVLAALAPSDVAAQASKYDAARLNHPELFQVYYDEGVMEYCGMATGESMSGFALSRDALLKAEGLDEEETRISKSTPGYQMPA